MSTNYYWIHDEPKAQYIKLPTGTMLRCNDATVPYAGTHIGKRYGFAGSNCKTSFMFATDPMLVLECIQNKLKYRPDEKIVVDEYGREFTVEEFSVLLYDNAHWELHAIGEEFC